jgi:hypothetical protein
MMKHSKEHQIPADLLSAYSGGRPLYAMVLADIVPVDPSPPYRPKQGAVHVMTDVEVA